MFRTNHTILRRIEGVVRNITPSSKALRTDLLCLGELRKSQEEEKAVEATEDILEGED